MNHEHIRKELLEEQFNRIKRRISNIGVLDIFGHILSKERAIELVDLDIEYIKMVLDWDDDKLKEIEDFRNQAAIEVAKAEHPKNSVFKGCE